MLDQKHHKKQQKHIKEQQSNIEAILATMENSMKHMEETKYEQVGKCSQNRWQKKTKCLGLGGPKRKKCQDSIAYFGR